MKKTIFVFLVALFASAFCFAQSMSSQARDLQGTWVLIGILNDEESYDEATIKKGTKKNLNHGVLLSLRDS